MKSIAGEILGFIKTGARNIFCVKRKIHNGTLSP